MYPWIQEISPIHSYSQVQHVDGRIFQNIDVDVVVIQNLVLTTYT